jgi:hypothetical protein
MSNEADHEYCADYRGECIGCQKTLLIGDKAHLYAEGEMACEQCAPSWATCRDEWAEHADQREAYPENYASFTKAYEAYIAEGGDVSKPVVHALL